MKKLELKNLKVIKLTIEEKKTVKGGIIPSMNENLNTGPYISWCNNCA